MSKVKYSIFDSDSVLDESSEFHFMTKDGRCRISHYPEDNARSETTVLYSKNLPRLKLSQAKGDYECCCDFCESDAGVSLGLMFEPAIDGHRNHFIEVVCQECGTRFVMKPVLSIHYEPVANSREDDDYESLIDLFKGLK